MPYIAFRQFTIKMGLCGKSSQQNKKSGVLQKHHRRKVESRTNRVEPVASFFAFPNGGMCAHLMK